jgi:hypothetical protein
MEILTWDDRKNPASHAPSFSRPLQRGQCNQFSISISNGERHDGSIRFGGRFRNFLERGALEKR